MRICNYTDKGKRILDFVLANAGLIIASPVIVFLAILVKLKIGGSPFFLQIRPGLNGKPFKIFKLTTMTNEKDKYGNLLPDSQRLTKLGDFLRKTSLDELPELFNVLKGDMSLVGPRPLLMEYLPLYTPEQARRHEVKPGITGWAQVNGRNAISWEEKFEKGEMCQNDNKKGQNVPKSLFLFDLKILAMTFLNVIKMEGITQPGMATAEKFKGTRSS